MNKKMGALFILTLLFYGAVFFAGHTVSEKRAADLKALEQKEKNFQKNLKARPELLGKVAFVFILVISLALALDVHILRMKMQGRALFPEPPPLISALWGLKEVLFLFILLFFSEACTTTIGIFASGFVHFNEAAKDLWVLTSSLLRDLAAVGFVFWIVKKKSAGIFSSIGLSTKDFLRNVRTGLLGYTAVIPALLVLLLGAALFWQTFSVEPPPQPVVEIYLKKSTEPFLLFLTFFVAAAGPVMEEILFRGFAYTAFRSRWGARAAGLGSAAIFAAMHGSLVAFVPIFFLGFFLAVLFEKTRSLVPSMTAHVAHNLVMVGMTLFFKTMSV